MRHEQRSRLIRYGKRCVILIAAILLLWWLFSQRAVPSEVRYGVSFSKLHADELGIPWREAYDAILDDLNVKRIRLSAHWPMIEPKDGTWNFSEMDHQVREASKRGVSIILGVGKRLPGWPECHVPEWLWGKEKEKIEEEVLEYIKEVVLRYRSEPSILYWQVENESFLVGFARYHCADFDSDFLDREIALVRSLDPGRKILLTDSGEIGVWLPAYKRADVFGSTLYLYTWHEFLKEQRYPIGPSFFRVKQNISDLVYGQKPKILVELSAEPWLLQPIRETPLDIQLSRMGMDKFKESITFTEKTGFDMAYLWGAEWWYYLKLRGLPEHWDYAKALLAK